MNFISAEISVPVTDFSDLRSTTATPTPEPLTLYVVKIWLVVDKCKLFHYEQQVQSCMYTVENPL